MADSSPSSSSFIIILCNHGHTGPSGSLALARWAGWSAVQVGRPVKCWSR